MMAGTYTLRNVTMGAFLTLLSLSGIAGAQEVFDLSPWTARPRPGAEE